MRAVLKTGRDRLYLLGLAGVLIAAGWFETINLSLSLSGGPDEGVYLGAARLLNHGYPFTTFFFDQFSLFPQILAAALRIGGDTVLTGRLTIVLFSILGAVALALLTRAVSTGFAAVLAVLFVAVNHYYLEQTRFAMAEVPGAALMLWALIAVMLYTDRRGKVWLLLGGVLSAAGLLVKPLTAGFILTIGLWLIISKLSQSDGRRKLDWRSLLLDLLLFSTAGVLTCLLFLNLSDLPGEFRRTVGFHMLETRLWSPTLADRFTGIESFLAENRGWLGLALLGLIGGAWKAPGRVIPLAIGELATVAMLLQLSPARHYYALLSPLLALFAAVGVQAGITALLVSLPLLRELAAVITTRATTAKLVGGTAYDRLWQVVGHRTILSLGPAAISLLAFALLLHDAAQLARYDHAVLTDSSHNTLPAVAFLKQHTRPGDFVISDDPMVVFRSGCLIPPSAINLSYPSTFRILNGSDQQLVKSVTEYPVKAFVVLGAYSGDIQLMQWISANYPIREVAGVDGQMGSALTYWREFH